MLHGWALKKVILQSKPTWLGFIVGKKCDPAEIFWKYLKTIIQLELHVKTNLNEKWKIAEYFGENLDILTYLIWIFNKSNWFQNIFSKYLGGITLLSYSAGVLISKMLFRVVGFYSKFPLICVLLIKKNRWFIQVCQPKKLIFHFTRYSLRSGPSCLEKMIGTDIWAL